MSLQNDKVCNIFPMRVITGFALQPHPVYLCAFILHLRIEFILKNNALAFCTTYNSQNKSAALSLTSSPVNALKVKM